MLRRTVVRLVASLAVSCSMCVAANAAVIYVNAAAAGSNDGTSWIDAFTDLQSALAVADDGDDVWVAAATYKPSSGSDRTATFTIVSGAGVYGGFAGTEVTRSQRDPAANVTILSGEIGAPGSADNSYHVVSAVGATSNTTLDGFTITGGNANGPPGDPSENGGGVYLDTASINIAHCIITGNSATNSGGGVVAAGGDPTIAFSTISNNTVTNGAGGGAVFSQGGGSISDSTISGNSSTSQAGGALVYGSVRITRCVIENNNGGGVGLSESTVLENSVIRGNTGTQFGGVALGGSSARMASCLVTRNILSSAFGSASGVSLSGGTLVNDTIADNAGAGPQVYGFSGTMTNCIVVAPGAGVALGPPSGAITVTYSDIVPEGYAGPGNLSVDPQFGNGYRLRSTSAAIDAGDNAALDGTMTFDLGGKPRSIDVPAVADTGAGSAPIVDMGSDEYSPSTVNVYPIGAGSGTVTSSPAGISCAPACIVTFAPGTTVTLTASPSAGSHFNGWEGDCSGSDPCVVTSPANVTARFGRVWFVKQTAVGSNNGTSWTDAFTDLQSALAVAVEGDDVWVAAATYKPSSGSDRAASFKISSGVGLYGGFAGTEALRSERDAAAHVTVLSGEIGAAGTADNSYHVVTALAAASNTTLDGFTITGGNADLSGDNDSGTGGGIFLDIAPLNIGHCVITGNTVNQFGGGILARGSLTVSFSTISNNTAANGGGAVLSEGSISDSTISGNVDTGGAGGLIVGGSARISRCVIRNNHGGVGGVSMQNSAVLENCLVTGNTVSDPDIGSPSGISLFGGTLINDTIADNPGSVPQVSGFFATMTNCIVAAPGPGPAIFGSMTVTYSDIVPDGSEGTGNINVAPQFIDAAGGNYRIQQTSACVDAGDNSALDATMTIDLAGKPRRVDVASVPDTGTGTAPVVDIGADEVFPITFNGLDAFNVCAGSSHTFTSGAAGYGALTYQWRKNMQPLAGETGASLTINSAAAGDDADYDIVVTDSLGRQVTSPEVHLQVSAGAPAINTQPSDVTACGTAMFTVSVSGDYVTYQWRKGGQPINGATSASYEITSPSVADNGTYDVLVGNACQTLTSDPVTLTYSGITVTANPADSVFSDGATAHFTAAATANPSPSVQWQRFNGSAFVDIPGANSLTLMLPVTVADNGAQFRAAFTNTCPTVFTTPAVLTVRQFTDPVITLNITPVRLVHFQQIRDRIYEHRTRYGVAPAQYPYTHGTLVNVTLEDLVEARTALAEAYAAAGRTAPTYTNTITRNVSKISKTDVDELRAACVALE